MAAIPTFEHLLLTVHEAFGCEAPRKKQELRDYGRPTAHHLDALSALLDDILAAIGLDDGAKADAKWNLLRFANFHKALEVGTWTFGAEMRHVAWYLLSWVYVPGLARHAAFWQLASPTDTGMPGGVFWYLPRIDVKEDGPRIRMPVSGVLDWLEDLLGQPIHRAAVSWRNGRTKVDPESAKRTLAKWRDGDVPRASVIQAYFAEGTELEFRECLRVAGNSSDEAELAQIQDFVRRRQLTPSELRTQIPMAQEGRIEKVLTGQGRLDEIQLFNRLMKDRYAQPSLRTIRNRMLVARAVQHAQRELPILLCPGVDPADPDPCRNKFVQLIDIYKQVYNLTIQAAAAGDDEAQQDAWFEQHLSPWDRSDLFLSILPSKQHCSAAELPELLTSRFASLRPGQPLEDWRAADADQAVALLDARRARCIKELDDIEAMEAALRSLRTGAQEAAALGAITSIAAIRHLAHGHDDSHVRIAAAERMSQLATTDDQRLDATLIHMDIYLNGHVQPEPAETQALVENLLHQAEANPGRSRRAPQLLNARAKHCLRGNEFRLARTYWKEALAACSGDSCGSLPGLIARDLFALEAATRPNGYHAANHERHVRIMAAFDVINGLHHPIEEVASQLADHFWEDLYRPYPGIEPREASCKRMG